MLETLDHAFENFLSPKCTIIPCRASVYIMPIKCEAVSRKTRMTRSNAGLLSKDGVSIISKELDEEPYTSERLKSLPGGFKCLSSDLGEKLIDINFENAKQINEYLFSGRTFERRIKCQLNKDKESQLDAIALWFELHLLDKNKFGQDIIISTKPSLDQTNKSKEATCWEQAVFPLLNPISVKSGDEIEIKINLKGHFSLESCVKTKTSEQNVEESESLTLKLPSTAIIRLNDTDLQNAYQNLAKKISSPVSRNEKWSNRTKLDILDLTETCSISLQLLKLNNCNNVTVGHIGSNSDELEDISATNFAMKIQYTSELALRNQLKVDNIDCVTSWDKAPDRSYDVILLEFVEPCGKLNSDYMQKIPSLRSKLRLSSPDSIILPQKVGIHCQLVQSDALKKMVVVDDNNVHGYKISSSFNKVSVLHLQDIDIQELLNYDKDTETDGTDHKETKFLCDPFEVNNIDVMSFQTDAMVEEEFELVVKENGTAHGIVYWLTQDYGWGISVSNYNPGDSQFKNGVDSCERKQAAIMFDPPIPVAKDDTLSLTFLHRNGLIDFVSKIICDK